MAKVLTVEKARPEEFAALKATAEGKVKTRLRKALAEIHRTMKKGRLPVELIEEAIRESRGLR